MVLGLDSAHGAREYASTGTGPQGMHLLYYKLHTASMQSRYTLIIAIILIAINTTSYYHYY